MRKVRRGASALAVQMFHTFKVEHQDLKYEALLVEDENFSFQILNILSVLIFYEMSF